MSDKVITDCEVTEKCLLPGAEKTEIELDKNELGNKNSSNCNDKIAENSGTNLKKDLSNDNDALERLLSEGEASSGFETVSSVQSNLDPDDFDLSSTADEDDFNVVVEIENELAFQTPTGSSERTFYWTDPRAIPDGCDKRPIKFSNDSTKNRNDDFRIGNKREKYWQSSSKEKNIEFDEYRNNEGRRDKKFSERDFFNRQQGLHDRNWEKRNDLSRKNFRVRGYYSRHMQSRRTDYDSRPRRSRSSDRDSRPRRSRSSNRDSRPRRSRSSDRESRTRYSRSSDGDSRPRCSRSSDRDSRTRYSRSSDRDYTQKNSKGGKRTLRPLAFGSSERNIRHSPGCKDRRRSRSFDRNSPTGLERGSPYRKRRCTSSIWQRLGGRTSLSRVKSGKRSRKKERTPFLVELERKLKEADRLKELQKENLNGSSVQTEVPTNVKPPFPEVLPNTTPNQIPPPNLLVPEMHPTPMFSPMRMPKPRMPMMPQNLAPTYPPKCSQPMPSIPRLGIPLHFSVPEKSVDNLPLVVGPTGLPVHITLTGEQIPHDLDGRRIPLGPNGYFLPLDPTGRLFPHIVSPQNQAVPIHMTDDGVLRLPNSEPVPYGPSHKLPVDIDGMIIPIGPDSRPLFPCPNFPKEPPLHLLNMIGNKHSPPLPPLPPPEVVQDLPEPPQTADQEIIPPAEEQPKPLQPTLLEMGKQNISPPGVEQTEIIKLPSPPKVDQITPPPPPPDTENHKIAPPAESQQTLNENQSDIEPPETDFSLVDLILTPSQKINKTDVLRNYKKKAIERSKDIEKCIEIEKNLGINPSKGGVKRSTPMKFSLKKVPRKTPEEDDSNTTVTDMDLESDHSDSTSGNKVTKENQVLLSSEEEQDILKAICDTETSKTPETNAGAKPRDALAKKVEKAIKALKERNYKPPVLGRFIISCFVDPVMRNSPNESPLLRNRIVLPFITPSPANPQAQDPSPAEENTKITFKFLPQEVSQRKKTPSDGSGSGTRQEKTSPPAKIPVFTFDFAMQCDFTSRIIDNLNSKIAELEMEVVKLKNKNANLVDSYKHVQAMNESKSEQLRKAVRDIRKRDSEIKALKSSMWNN